MPDPGFDPEEQERFDDLLRQLREMGDTAGKDAFKALQKAYGSKASQATELVALANDAELWHDRDSAAYATLRVGTHVEHWPVRSRAFRTWLQHAFYREREKAPGSQATQDALAVLEGRARFEGDENPVFVRLGYFDGALYLDLADDEWRCIKVTASGWSVLADAPVRFKRRRGMLALPIPETGGSLTDLRDFVNVTDDDFVLLLGWLVGALHPRGPYPLLELAGEHGSAKTTT